MVERDSSIRVHGSPPNMATRWLHFSGILGRVTTNGGAGVRAPSTTGQPMASGSAPSSSGEIIWDAGVAARLRTDQARGRSTSSIGPERQATGAGTDRPAADHREWLDQWLVRPLRRPERRVDDYLPTGGRVVHPSRAGPDPPGQAESGGRREDGPRLRQRGFRQTPPNWPTVSSDPPSRSPSGTESSIAMSRPSRLARGATTAPRPTTC